MNIKHYYCLNFIVCSAFYSIAVQYYQKYHSIITVQYVIAYSINLYSILYAVIFCVLLGFMYTIVSYHPNLLIECALYRPVWVVYYWQLYHDPLPKVCMIKCPLIGTAPWSAIGAPCSTVRDTVGALKSWNVNTATIEYTIDSNHNTRYTNDTVLYATQKNTKKQHIESFLCQILKNVTSVPLTSSQVNTVLHITYCTQLHFVYRARTCEYIVLRLNNWSMYHNQQEILYVSDSPTVQCISPIYLCRHL